MDRRRGYYPTTESNGFNNMNTGINSGLSGGGGGGLGGFNGAMPLDGQEWESSFSQILNRTRQNINRISQRYGTNTAPSNASSYDVTGDLPKRGSSATMNRLARSVEDISIGDENITSNQPKTALFPSQSRYSPLRTRPTVDSKLNVGQRDSIDDNEAISVDASTLKRIFDRLNQLEQQQAQQVPLAGTLPNNIESRIASIESTLDHVKKTVESAVAEGRETHRLLLQVQGQVSRQAGILEAVQHDVDSRRGLVAKMDGWARQGEVWREEIDTQLANINKHIKSSEKLVKAQSESLDDRATKTDLLALKDKMSVFTQQAVAASMSAWHDKIESSVRSVEKQVAALRIGKTVSSAASGDLNEEEVKAALSTAFPSELLLKGMVNAEVRELEASVEEKVDSRVRSSMRVEVMDNCKAIKSELKEYISRLASELGLLPQEGETVSVAMKAVAARRSSDRQVEELMNKIDDFSQALLALQDKADSTEVGLRVDMRGLERRVEECVTIAATSVSSVQSRCASLEEVTRTAELQQRGLHLQMKDELMDRIREAKDDWTTDRINLDRRLLIVERISEEMLERAKTSTAAIDAYFNSSKQIKKFELAAVRLETIQSEVAAMKAEVREAATGLVRIDALSARKDDLIELRDRVAGVEPFLDQVTQLLASSRTMTEDVYRMKGSVASHDSITTALQRETQELQSRLSSSEVLLEKVRLAAAEASNAGQVLSRRTQQNEEQIKQEVSTLKESTYALTKKLTETEGRLSMTEMTLPSLAQLPTSLSNLQVRVKDAESNITSLRVAHDALKTEKADIGNRDRSAKAPVDPEQSTALESLGVRVSMLESRISHLENEPFQSNPVQSETQNRSTRFSESRESSPQRSVFDRSVEPSSPAERSIAPQQSTVAKPYGNFKTGPAFNSNQASSTERPVSAFMTGDQSFTGEESLIETESFTEISPVKQKQPVQSDEVLNMSGVGDGFDDDDDDEGDGEAKITVNEGSSLNKFATESIASEPVFANDNRKSSSNSEDDSSIDDKASSLSAAVSRPPRASNQASTYSADSEVDLEESGVLSIPSLAEEELSPSRPQVTSALPPQASKSISELSRVFEADSEDSFAESGDFDFEKERKLRAGGQGHETTKQLIAESRLSPLRNETNLYDDAQSVNSSEDDDDERNRSDDESSIVDLPKADIEILPKDTADVENFEDSVISNISFEASQHLEPKSTGNSSGVNAFVTGLPATATSTPARKDATSSFVESPQRSEQSAPDNKKQQDDDSDWDEDSSIASSSVPSVSSPKQKENLIVSTVKGFGGSSGAFGAAQPRQGLTISTSSATQSLDEEDTELQSVSAATSGVRNSTAGAVAGLPPLASGSTSPRTTSLLQNRIGTSSASPSLSVLSPSSTPTSQISTGALSIKERLRLRQEELKRSKTATASGSSTAASSPVTVPTPSTKPKQAPASSNFELEELGADEF